MTDNKDILLTHAVRDPCYKLALMTAEKDELEAALLECKDKKKLGQIRAALRRIKTRERRAEQYHRG